MVKYGICYIFGLIATKRRANILIEIQASYVTNGFDLDHDHDLWIFKVKCDLDLWPHTWPWPWIFVVKFWNSCISESEGRLTLNQGGGSRSFMTMSVTKVRCKDLPDSYRGDFRCRRAIDSSSLNLVNVLIFKKKLEQLERLRSEIPPRPPMITHTGDSYQIPSQNKTKSKFQIFKNCQNFNQNCRHYRVDTGCGMDGWTDGRTDGRMEWNQYTPLTTLLSGGIIKHVLFISWLFAIKRSSCECHRTWLMTTHHWLS